MNTRQKQGGLSFIGMLIVCAVLGFAALVVMKLWPLYNEKFKVIQSMEAVAAEANIRNGTLTDIKKAMMRNFDVQDVDEFTMQNIGSALTVTKNQDGTRTMNMNYEIRGPLFGELDVVLKFDHSVEIPRGDN